MEESCRMLIAGAVACALGALEFFLNTRLFPAVFAGDYKKVLLLLAAKLAVYGLAIWLLLAFFKAYLVGAAVGFGAGFLLYLIIYGVKSLSKKDG